MVFLYFKYKMFWSLLNFFSKFVFWILNSTKTLQIGNCNKNWGIFLDNKIFLKMQKNKLRCSIVITHEYHTYEFWVIWSQNIQKMAIKQINMLDVTKWFKCFLQSPRGRNHSRCPWGSQFWNSVTSWKSTKLCSKCFASMHVWEWLIWIIE